MNGVICTWDARHCQTHYFEDLKDLWQRNLSPWPQTGGNASCSTEQISKRYRAFSPGCILQLWAFSPARKKNMPFHRTATAVRSQQPSKWSALSSESSNNIIPHLSSDIFKLKREYLHLWNSIQPQQHPFASESSLTFRWGSHLTGKKRASFFWIFDISYHPLKKKCIYFLDLRHIIWFEVGP